NAPSRQCRVGQAALRRFVTTVPTRRNAGCIPFCLRCRFQEAFSCSYGYAVVLETDSVALPAADLVLSRGYSYAPPLERERCRKVYGLRSLAFGFSASHIGLTQPGTCSSPDDPV